MQSQQDVTTNLIERLHWCVAWRDEGRSVKRWRQKQPVEAIYVLEKGAILEEWVHFLDEGRGPPPLASVAGRRSPAGDV